MAFGVESLDFYTGGQLFHTDVVGCMDENNLNYDPNATINDGDRCGGCVEGYTRLGDPAFTCQEVKGKIVDCKTGDVYWRLKKEYKHTPSLSTYYSEEGYWRGSAYAVKTMTLGNDGTPWLKNKNDPKNKNQVMWETKHREIKDKCGSYEVLPVLPQDVPNFLGLPNSTPAKNIPAQKTPANVAAQDTSTTLNNTSMTTLSHQVQPIEPTAPTTNWPLIIAVAVGVYLFTA